MADERYIKSVDEFLIDDNKKKCNELNNDIISVKSDISDIITYLIDESLTINLVTIKPVIDHLESIKIKLNRVDFIDSYDKLSNEYVLEVKKYYDYLIKKSDELYNSQEFLKNINTKSVLIKHALMCAVNKSTNPIDAVYINKLLNGILFDENIDSSLLITILLQSNKSNQTFKKFVSKLYNTSSYANNKTLFNNVINEYTTFCTYVKLIVSYLILHFIFVIYYGVFLYV